VAVPTCNRTDRASGFNLEPSFVEADDLESARKALHAFVDARVDHLLHMDGLVRGKEPPPARANPKSEQRSISIGLFRDEGGEPTLGLE
jgi:hypothetical protein